METKDYTLNCKWIFETLESYYYQGLDYGVQDYKAAMKDVLNSAQEVMQKDKKDKDDLKFLEGLNQLMGSYGEMHKSLKCLRKAQRKYPSDYVSYERLKLNKEQY